VLRCLEPGLSIIVGTTDAKGAPASCRGIAIASHDDLATVTVFLPVATSHEAIQNIALTKRMAVSSTNMADHSSTQMKGTTIDARLATEDESAYVRSRFEAFVQGLMAYGVSPRLARSVRHWPAFAVTLKVEQMFEQTPGPNAGRRMR